MRRILVAALVLAAIAGNVGLWLLALHTGNARLEMVLLYVDALLVGGLACAPTGVYLMRGGRGGRSSSLPGEPAESDAERIERLTR
jgi:hypothetical protein